MISRIASWVTLAAFLSYSLGCTSTVNLRQSEVKKPPEHTVGVVLYRGDTLSVNRHRFPAWYDSQAGTVIALTKSGKPDTLDVDEIAVYRVKKFDSEETVLVLGITASACLVGLVVLGLVLQASLDAAIN